MLSYISQKLQLFLLSCSKTSKNLFFKSNFVTVFGSNSHRLENNNQVESLFLHLVVGISSCFGGKWQMIWAFWGVIRNSELWRYYCGECGKKLVNFLPTVNVSVSQSSSKLLWNTESEKSLKKETLLIDFSWQSCYFSCRGRYC